jgi:iron(III) transport system ATP-binding protein
MVTHDQEEALAMADRIVVMSNGQIQQTGKPEEIYRSPINDFVADFIGRGNLIEASPVGSQHVRAGDLMLRCGVKVDQNHDHRFYVRPEDIRLHNILDDCENSFTASVLKYEFLGPYCLVTLDAKTGQSRPLVAQFSSNYLAGQPIHPGSILRVGIPAEHLLPMPSAL